MDERLECSTLEIKDSQTECSWIPNTPVKHGIVKHLVCEENNLEIPQPTQADTRNCVESGESSVCRDASVMSPDFGNEGLILLTDAARESSYTTSVFEFEAEDEGATLQEESLNSSGAKGKSILPEENNTLASTGNEDHVYLKTPQRKPKRKKHKPKVISSNQPKLNSRTTKPALSEECTPTKAKCARKNAGNTSMKGRTDADTDTDDADTDADDVQTPKRNYTTRKSCIRSLDFDSYEQVATERSTSPCRSMLIQDTEARRRKRGRLFPDDIYFYSMNAVWDDDYSSLQECSSYIRQPIEFYEKLQTLEFPAVCKKKRTKRDARVSTNASSSHSIIPQHDDTNLNSTSSLGNPTPLKKGRSGGATWTMDLAALSWCPMIDGFSRQLAKVQSALEPLTKKRRSKGVTRPRDFAALSLSWCRMADGFSRQLTKVHSAPPVPQACTPTKRRSRTYVLGSSFPAKDSECLLSVDAIVEQFSRLDIAAECKTLANLNMNAKICVNRIGWTMISFDALNDHTSNSRPKVDLDEETTRVWKLLLEDINNEGVDGIDEEKRKTWQKEREVFHGRANSFIAKMRLIQGDRHFCRWKGSIVDSVVGVFLTQNVSDHLSSSAFMSMAARFPLSRNNKESTDNLRSPSSVYQDSFLDEKTPKCCSDTCFVELLQLQEPGCVNVNSVDAAVPWDAERLPNNCFPTNLDLNEHFGTEQTGLSEESSSYINLVETTTNVTDPIITPKTKRGKRVKNKKNKANWDSLRNEANSTCKRDRRTAITMDSVDWEAVRCAEVGEIVETIKDRGMYNMLAERIKEFLNRVKKDHGSIDLEWLRDVPPDKAKEYLLSIRGLGLKSVECVRLLTLHHVAFPVDTNVGRIVVRLGWVPLQPLPESLQLHLLELYPVLDSIQKYLWPRLCKLDQKTLYELHYQMITFGKVFCTKNKPNCNSCPMRGECRHFASAYASARLALPAPEEAYSSRRVHHLQLLLKPKQQRSQHFGARWYLPTLPQVPVAAVTSKPIIEEPPDSPEPEEETLEELEEEPFINNEEFQTAVDMEDLFRDDEIPTIDLNIEADLFRDDEIPTIDLNIEALNHNLQNILQNRTRLTKLQDNNSEHSSNALVVLTPEAASIPMPKLKNRNRLRTEHLVYVIPDSHELLKGLDKREINDPSPYLLAIWSPGETINCVQPPERKCSIRLTGELCCEDTCFACNSIRQDASQTVRGTILIPCRTAMRGSFPLNGTYFQVNEVFADHETSLRPINVPRNWLWNMRRQTVYFGTSIPTIFKGMGLPEICHCFRKGFVCVRGFDRTTRGPRPLIARLHFPASKLARNREAAESNS